MRQILGQQRLPAHRGSGDAGIDGIISLVEGIVLVDGVRLAGLMVDHEVGVTARVLTVPKVDVDYFEE